VLELAIENDKTCGFTTIFFQSLGEITCSLQPALKDTAPNLQRGTRRIAVFL